MGEFGLSSAARQNAAVRTNGGFPSRPGPHATFTNSDRKTGGSDRPDCDTWDDGRLVINRRFARLLNAHRLTTFQRLYELGGGDIVRRVGTRETARITLEGEDGPVELYLKRHGAPAWRDRIMPWLHGSRPILGARNEWEAIFRFMAAGIPTMTPVAFGECQGGSLLVTEALPAKCNLLEGIGGRIARGSDRLETPAADGARYSHCNGHTVREWTVRVADIAKRMHAAGLHHQDFYLNHLLLCKEAGSPDIRVIDLGRVRHEQPLSKRWIVKDLAQLNFSAERLSKLVRLRFLRMYLGRRFSKDDRQLVRRIALKSQRIAAHTAKHDL